MRTFVNSINRTIDKELPPGVQSMFTILNERIYQKRSTGVIEYHPIAICGGFVRDLLYDKKYNDVDIITSVDMTGRNLLAPFGPFFWDKGEEQENHRHLIYHNGPYDFKIHIVANWTDVDDSDNSQIIIHPGAFDFSINELHVDHKGRFYATPNAWFDYDNRILRLNPGRIMTTNVFMRMIRLAVKCNLKIDELTLKYAIFKINKQYIDETVVLKQLNKMIEDGVNEEAFRWLQVLQYPRIDRYKNIEELRDELQESVTKFMDGETVHGDFFVVESPSDNEYNDD